jgi:hypothetical protein
MSEILAVIIGGLLGYGGTFLTKCLDQTKEENNLAFSFRGEIKAHIELGDKLKLLERVSLTIEECKKTGDNVKLDMPVQGKYSNVFESKVDSIGVLDSTLPEKIVQYYMKVQVIFITLNNFYDGKYEHFEHERYLGTMMNLKLILIENRSDADYLVNKIGKLYPKCCFSRLMYWLSCFKR